MTQVISFLMLTVMLVALNGCSSLLSATREEPIGENYGKRTTGAYVDDQLIETKAKVNLLETDERFRKARIRVHSYNGVVLLIGQVPQQDMRGIATSTVEKIRKVRRVNNELQVLPPRSFAASIGDFWLGSKLKTRLLFNQDIQSGRVKIIVENNVLYLMGLVTRQEADMIVDAARKTYGLQKIVRVFEYID